MKPRHGLLIAAGLAVVMVVLFAVPFLIDTGRYREILLPRMETALGRKVAVKGPISFSLLPMPSFTFDQVSLGEAAAGNTVSLADLSRLKLYVRPWPLLLGRIDVSSMTLSDPDIRLTLKADPAAAASGEAEATMAPVLGEPVLSGLPKVGKVTIKNGSLTLLWPPHDPVRIESIDADLGNRDGDLRANGSARADGVDFSFDGTIGRNGAGIPVTLGLSSTRGGARLRLAGSIERGNGAHPFKGKLTASLSDLPLFAKQFGEAASGMAWPAGKFSLEAQLSGATDELTIEQMSFEVGGADGRGSARLAFSDMPQADLNVAFNRLDLDSLIAAAGSYAANSASRAAAMAGGDAQMQSAPASGGHFALPKALAVNLDLNAAAVIVRGGLVKGAHLNAALANGEMVLNQASLALPGNTDLNLFGVLAADNGQPVFDGSFEAASGDLPGFCDWLKIDFPKVPAGRLQSARFVGKIKARPGDVALEGAEAKIDGSTIRAAATLHLGARPAFGVSFAVDGFNADAYRPVTVRKAEPGKSAGAPVNKHGAPAPGGWLPAWMAGVDGNIQGRVGQIMVAGGNAQTVSVNAGWHEGRLDLADLSVGDFAGAQLQLAGRVDGLTSAAPMLQNLRYVLKVRQLGHLLGQVGSLLPVDLDGLGPISALGTLSGNAADLTIDGRTEAAGASLNLSGHVRQLDGIPSFDLDLAASHAAWGQLVRLFLPDYHPAGGQGAFAASTHLSGGRGDLTFGDLRLKFGVLSAAGQARLAGHGRQTLDLTLAAGEFAVDPFLQSVRKGEAGSSVREMIHTGVLVPSRGPKPGVAQAAPDRVGGGDSLDRITAAPRAAVVASDIPDRWGGQPLDLGWLAKFDGNIHLQAQAVSFGHLRVGQAAVEASLKDGNLSVSRLSGQLYGGDLSGEGHLGSGGDLSAKLALAHGRMKEALLGIADLDVADGLMEASANFSTNGRSGGEMIGRLSGSGSFSVSNGVIHGFDLAAVDQRLDNHEASAAGLLTLLQAGLTGGKTAFSRFSGSLKANNGLLAVSDLVLVADGGTAKAHADINLSAAMMDGRAEFRLASAPSAPPLVMHLSGPLAAPHRTVEINAIQSWLAQNYKAPPPPARKPAPKKGRR